MGKVDVLREMEDAWKEVSEHSQAIDQIERQLNESRSPRDLQSKLSQEKRQYQAAMSRYKQASRSYYNIAIGGLR